MSSAIDIPDRSFNQREVNAATAAVIDFVGEIVEIATILEIIEIVNDQLTSIWHILNEDVRNSIIITVFSEYDIDVTA